MATKKVLKKPAARATKSKLRAVVVTTQHRGVFIGETDAHVGADVVVLRKGRNVFYWTNDTKGFVGIASRGLFTGAKVGPPADVLELRNVTSVIDATAEAAASWERVSW